MALGMMERLLQAVLPAACILVLLTAVLLPWEDDAGPRLFVSDGVQPAK